MKVKEHIDRYFSGNITHFAESIGKHRQQVQRWIKMDCIVIDGDVYENKSKRGKKDAN